MNKCMFLGRITKDLEVRHVGADDTSILNFTLAVNRKFKRDGQPDADFFNMVAIGKVAEIIAQYCEKGSQIAVVSRSQTRNWEDKEGNKRNTTEFVVEEFSFASGSKSSGGNKPTSSDEDDFEL